MAEEFEIPIYGRSLRGESHGRSGMEEFLRRHDEESENGFYVLVVGAGASLAGAAPAIESLMHGGGELKAIYGQRGTGKGVYSQKFELPEELLAKRGQPTVGEVTGVSEDIIGVRVVSGAIDPKGGGLGPEAKSGEPRSGGDSPEPEVDSDARLEEIRKLLRESRQLGEQIREGIDSLKERAPVR